MENTQKSMKGLCYKSYGKPADVVTLESDLPIPECGPTQLLIRVEAAALNPVDWKLIGGFAASLPIPNFILPRASESSPLGVGLDVAGTVAKIGSKVPAGDWNVGDEVYAVGSLTSGSMAQYYALDASVVGKKPKNLSMAEAASLPLAALTSYQSLFVHGGLCPKDSAGKKVLILGGSGGTGSLGIQLAKAAGAFVATSCSGRNAEFVKSLGADIVIDYTKESFEEVLKGEVYDLVYDCVGGHDYWVSAQSILKPKTGYFISIVGDTEQLQLTLPSVFSTAYHTLSRNIGALFGRCSRYNVFLLKPRKEELEQLTAWVEEKKVKPLIQQEYPLSEFQEAFKQSMSHRTRGKLVLNI